MCDTALLSHGSSLSTSKEWIRHISVGGWCAGCNIDAVVGMSPRDSDISLETVSMVEDVGACAECKSGESKESLECVHVDLIR